MAEPLRHCFFTAFPRHDLDCARHVSFMAPCRKKKKYPIAQWSIDQVVPRQSNNEAGEMHLSDGCAFAGKSIEDAMSWYEKPRHEDA